MDQYRICVIFHDLLWFFFFKFELYRKVGNDKFPLVTFIKKDKQMVFTCIFISDEIKWFRRIKPLRPMKFRAVRQNILKKASYNKS